jgi:hypothetical protein
MITGIHALVYSKQADATRALIRDEASLGPRAGVAKRS